MRYVLAIGIETELQNKSPYYLDLQIWKKVSSTTAKAQKGDLLMLDIGQMQNC